MESEVTTMAPETTTGIDGSSLGASVKSALQQYFAKLDGTQPAELYGMVLAEVEKPLLEMVLQLTGNNQSRAATILGLSRGTLRKKMAIYDLF